MKYDQIWNPEIILHNNQGTFYQIFVDSMCRTYFVGCRTFIFDLKMVKYKCIWIDFANDGSYPQFILDKNHIDGNYYPESFSDFQLTVYSNGTIIYSPAGIFVSFVLTIAGPVI